MSNIAPRDTANTPTDFPVTPITISPCIGSDDKIAEDQWRIQCTAPGTTWGEQYVSFSGYFGSYGPHVFAAAPELLEILDETIAAYGKPGGPWNVPSDPGGWLDRARKLSAKAKGETA